MASSTKVQFKLETLKEKAVESIDERIMIAVEELEAYDTEEVIEARNAEWRKDQEARISEVFSRLGGDDISDEELARFRVQEMPTNDLWVERNRANSQINRLRHKRSQILAKASSLVADEDGNISLTSTQLDEFFGL